MRQTVKLTESELRQAIANVLNNTRKHTARGVVNEVMGSLKGRKKILKEETSNDGVQYMATIMEGYYVEDRWNDGEIGRPTYYSVNVSEYGNTIMDAIKKVISRCCSADFDQQNLYNMGDGDIRYNYMEGVDKNNNFFTMSKQDFEDWKQGKMRAVNTTLFINVTRIGSVTDEELTQAGIEMYG